MAAGCGGCRARGEIPASLVADGGRRCPRSIRKATAPLVPGQRWCRVSFGYAPGQADELPLRAGELVQILEEIEDGWWLGRKNGRVGAFPSNFVQELPPGPAAPEPPLKSGAGKQRLKVTDETFIVKKAEKETGAEGWWEGERDGARGLFPGNVVTLLPPPGPKTKAAVPSRSQESVSRLEKKVSGASKAEQRPPQGPKEPKVQKKTDPPKMNLPASKKTAPAPPVPAKSKLASSLGSRPPCAPTTGAAPGGEKNKPREPGANCFDAVLVSPAKLSHPTAARPKRPGRKLPSQPPPSSAGEELPVSSKSRAPAGQPQPPASPATEQETLSLEELRAEIRSLHILMDLMRGQHQRDMEELRTEMKEERARRQALQREIQSVRQTPALGAAGAAGPGSEVEELPAGL